MGKAARKPKASKTSNSKPHATDRTYNESNDLQQNTFESGYTLWWKLVALLGPLLVTSLYQTIARRRSTWPSLLLLNEDDIKCNFYMAPSTIPNANWGVFSAHEIAPRQPVLYGESVIQVVDLDTVEGMRTLVHSYIWKAQVTGGHLQGEAVHSVIPGLGMLTNGHATQFNVVPDAPQYDNGGVSRFTSPVAGSSTHFHGLYHYSYREVIPAGGEILLNYGTGWKEKLSDDPLPKSTVRDVAWLKRHGSCLDHIRPGPTQEHGRGAYATRSLRRSTIVAPVPVLPLGRSNVDQQLLLNYCYGHANSSILLFPYSPIFNFVNHNATHPNAKLVWKSRPSDFTLDRLTIEQPSGLLLELIALRDIAEGEEVTMDYGSEWQRAWDEHRAAWQPPPGENDGGYVYAQEYANPQQEAMEDRAWRTVDDDPYPANLQTACFIPPDGIPSVNRIYPTNLGFRRHPSQLVPCRIVHRTRTGDRHEDGSGGSSSDDADPPITSQPQFTYTVEIQGITVYQVPPMAIQIVDRPHTADQFLENAFRHFITNVEYPPEWLDL